MRGSYVDAAALPGRGMFRGVLLGALLFLSGCGTYLDALVSCADAPGSFDCVTPDRSASGYAVAGRDDGAAAPLPSAAPRQPGAAEREYERRFVALLAANRLSHMKEANGIGPHGRSYLDVASHDFHTDFRAVEETASAVDMPLQALPAARREAVRHFTRPWRTSRNVIFLGKGSGLAGAKTFYFSGLQALKVLIDVEPVDNMPGILSGTCDGGMSVRAAGRARDYVAGEPMTILVGGDERGTVLEPDVALTRCDYFYETEARTYSAPLTLLREETADPALAEFDSRYEVCGEPAPERLSALQRAFFTSRWLSQTCAMPAGRPTLLDDERAGFNAKVKALLGRTLPARAFDEANPEWPLDFSRAPQLSLIYVSYLDIKADFSGRVIERLLRWHAARGTKIRVMVTDILEREKDRALLRKLAADYPNIRLQEFAWTPPAGSAAEQQLYRLLRTHHVKMLGTLAREPGRSTVIIGGRNIHDGFLFNEPVDLTGYEGLYQHSSNESELSLHYYANYNDFEVAYRDDVTVRRMMAQMSTLWHRDIDTTMVRPYSISVEGYSGGLRHRARHFISVPYADGRALERSYVELIDAARKTIEFVNPYLNPTPAIAAAIDRALSRGVKITIVGRIDLKGDLGGKVLTALNELFVEKYADRIAIYEYRVPNLLL
ncbi:MAG: phosphatidylserine/phosphatidylglycerophosphate/cardiolipin synthase family protein, partial [Rhizobiaceae bacterium]|nr:phosphatidylserine/phosphatidylglycerophosphate/cardiolipin synthase family protein [Rhizobiaceae bacterium]